MKLIRQTALWNNEGNADKVYEIDLCETAPNRYVVNFRYGRRGANLKDGTKTAMPVSLTQAEDIFKNLIEEKRKGGYRDTDNYVADAQSNPTFATAPEKINNELHTYVLNRLQEATQSSAGKNLKKWPLGRIIWRAGELRITNAAPLIIPQLTKGNALMQYIACWSLGRCGNSSAIEPLEQVYGSKASSEHVKRMALVALLALKNIQGTDDALLENLLTTLPEQVQSFLQNDKVENLKIYLVQATSTPESLHHATTIYLLAEHFAAAATAIFEWLKEITLVPNQFKVARHIFKIAEFREDAPIFSLLAYKFETTSGLFTYNYWKRNSYVYYNGKDFKHAIDEQKKENAGLAYSDTTKNYLMRRTWRTMRTLGKDHSEAYVRFAFGVLLQYNNGLEGDNEPEEIEQSFYSYNQATRSYENNITTKLYSAHANSMLLNYILFSGGNRYFLKRNNTAWQLQQGTPETAEKREDAFPELWDRYPQALVQLLFDSEVELVHNFAVKALKDRSDLAQYFDLTALKSLFQKPFAATAKLAMVLAEKMYDANHPDEELVSALLLHPIADARKLAISWISNQFDYFFTQTTAVVHLIVNPYDDVFEVANKWLTTRKDYVTESERLSKAVIDQLLILQPVVPWAAAAADHAAQLLSNHFLRYLTRIDLAVIEQLLLQKVAPTQMLGAIILLHHPIPPQDFPDGLLSLMIQSNNPQVRQAGITLFGRLPESQLYDNPELIAAFCVSPYQEIREAIQPTVKNLNDRNNLFGEKLLVDLLPYMHRKETAEGLHGDLLQLFTGPLASHVATIDSATALSFIHGRFPVPQILGLFIFKNGNKSFELSMRQWVRLANHEALDIRQFSWGLFNEHVPRVQAEASESLRILDSSWDDSRSFAFRYFREHFTETTWTPELLVSVCDSTRTDVQSFGREMITKYFQEENGELYLMQLSQHPAQQVQHFTTHYLEQFAADKPLNIEKLEAYFITVLSLVNKAGIAKKRIFYFLQTEALKNKQVAEIATRIIARQSATMAVSDKAACIGILYELQKKYPELDMPLTMVAVPVYEKV